MNRLLLAAVLLAAPSLSAQEPAARVYELSEVETPPRPFNVQALREALDASYPAEKRAAGEGARVAVEFVVGTDGAPGALRVTESTDSAFNSATVAGLALLRFSPATVGGQPVPVRVEMPVTWTVPPAPQASAEPVVSPTGREVNGERTSDVTVKTEGYELTDLDEPPRPLNSQVLLRELERRYPPMLRSAATEGRVQLRFRIDARGTVIDPIVVTRSSDPEFNTATIEAVRVLRFQPARVDGRPVIVWVELPIEWTVDGPGLRLEEDRRNGTDRPMFGRPRP
jgi:TonB family protein